MTEFARLVNPLEPAQPESSQRVEPADRKTEAALVDESDVDGCCVSPDSECQGHDSTAKGQQL